MFLEKPLERLSGKSHRREDNHYSRGFKNDSHFLEHHAKRAGDGGCGLQKAILVTFFDTKLTRIKSLFWVI
jgi:hypothetical protein